MPLTSPNDCILLSSKSCFCLGVSPKCPLTVKVRCFAGAPCCKMLMSCVIAGAITHTAEIDLIISSSAEQRYDNVCIKTDADTVTDKLCMTLVALF